MLRGTLTLTPAEVNQLHTSLTEEQITDPLLLEKVAIATQTDQVNEITLELSKEEAELIVDVLPTPQPDEPATLTQARTKIRLFMVSLSAHA